MKNYLIYFCIGIFIVACAEKKQKVNPNLRQRIQSIEVVEKINLTRTGQGSYYYPRFSPDGSMIFFTSSNYGGLSYFDLTTNKIVLLNNMPGAGSDFCFSSDNSAVFFKSDTMQNRRRLYNVFMQDIESKKLYKLNNKSIRKVTGLSVNDENVLIYWRENQLMSIDRDSGESVPATSKYPKYRIQGDKLIVFEKGNAKTFTPFPNQNLIWIEPVPASSDILIYVVGYGLYNFNPQKNLSILIGDFRAARSSPDGSLLAYMRDEDDGHRVTGSDIFVATMDDLRTFTITNTNDEIEMYPQWAPDGRRLVIHTDSGKIKMVNIKIN